MRLSNKKNNAMPVDETQATLKSKARRSGKVLSLAMSKKIALRKKKISQNDREQPDLLPFTSIDIVPHEDFLQDIGIMRLASRDQDDDSIILPAADRYGVLDKKERADVTPARNVDKLDAPKKAPKGRHQESRDEDEEEEYSIASYSLDTDLTEQGGCVKIIDGIFMCLDPIPEDLERIDNTGTYSFETNGSSY